MGNKHFVIAYTALTSALVAVGSCSPKTTPGQCDPYLQVCTCHAEEDCPAPWVCANSGVCEIPRLDAGPPDAEPADSAIPDAAPPDAAPDSTVRYGFGEPCSDKLQCESFICIFVATGGFCSMLCQGGSCPTGFGCVGVLDAVEQGVVSDVCVPETNLLCTQCASHPECNLIGQDLCLPDPLGGSFCARDCTVVSCPTGYTCQDVELAGLPFRQCLPESGSCNCTAANVGTTAPCDLTTPFGTCQGTRECLGSTGWGPCEAPNTVDEPDGAFTDDDCDGIDGRIDGGIYVSTAGVDHPTCGLTHLDTCRTINHGITQAASSGRVYVYIQAGTYYEVIALAEGIHLVGGFDATWQRAPRMNVGHTVTVVGGVDLNTGQYMTVRAYGLAATTRILDLVLVGPTALGTVSGNGRSSYVLWAVSSSGLSIERVTFQAGNGVPGIIGNDGLEAPTVSATSAMNGTKGGDAGQNGSACDYTTRGAAGSAGTNSCASGRAPSGGAGGTGGTMDTDGCVLGVCTDCAARPGTSGTSAAYNLPNSYGYRGAGSSPCATPSGGNGGTYVNGTAGTAGAGGFILDQFWYAAPGTAGTTGDNGTGGGGGGGSGGCDDGTDSWGAGGGGGGAGGCAARGAGTGGGGGGGSFGLFLVSSSVTATECVVMGGTGADGGRGGAGGRGQSGGSAGAGGLGAGGSQPGGSGGAGLHGGHGGGGGGGAGGVSYGVYGVGSASLPTCTFSGGARGAGGAGGLSAPTAPLTERDGADGPAGQSAPTPSYTGSCSSPPTCN